MNIHPADVSALPGFAAPVHDAQSMFRVVLQAMSHPGEVIPVTDLPDAPAPLNKASAAICLSLVDFETPLWADGEIAASGQALSHVRFHCGCPVTPDPKAARTALISNVARLGDLGRFNIGTDERPDQSTTVIVQVDGFTPGKGRRLRGPGIETVNRLDVLSAGDAFWDGVRANAQLFPCGVDLILTTDDAVVCLPRTVQVGD